MRISKKRLETKVDNLNYFTKHKTNIFFGCGVYLIVDGVEYDKVVKGEEDCRTGITNKKAYEILSQYDNEVMEGFNRRNNNG